MHTPVIVEINNQKTLVHANKTGYMHYLDAKTGKFLQAPQIADKITWANGYDSDGNPIWAQAVPEEGVEAIVWPGLLGAVNMSPVAYNPTDFAPSFFASSKKFSYSIKVADFYYKKTAKLMIDRIKTETAINEVKLIKLSKTNYRVLLGPFNDINSLIDYF